MCKGNFASTVVAFLFEKILHNEQRNQPMRTLQKPHRLYLLKNHNGTQSILVSKHKSASYLKDQNLIRSKQIKGFKFMCIGY